MKRRHSVQTSVYIDGKRTTITVDYVVLIMIWAGLNQGENRPKFMDKTTVKKITSEAKEPIQLLFDQASKVPSIMESIKLMGPSRVLFVTVIAQQLPSKEHLKFLFEMLHEIDFVENAWRD